MRSLNFLRLVKTKVITASLLLLGLIVSGRVAAQQVTIATGLPSSASSGSSSAPSVVTFCLNNTRTSAVTLKGIDNYMSSSNGGTVWKLYYSASSLSGQPNVTTWTIIDSVTAPTYSSTGIYSLFSGLSFPIPASTTYRFALQTTATIINYGGATTTPNSQTVANIDLYRGDYLIGSSNVGYAGTASAPPFFPRFFCGTVYLDTGVAKCAGTPTAAVLTTAPMSPAAPICAGNTKTLTVTYPVINGITYQWQSAASATGPWASVTGGTGATTLSYTTAALSTTTFYRLAVTCSNSNLTAYSLPYPVYVGLAQPGAITGPPTFCPGGPATYSVPAVSGATYAWTIPSGWTGTSTSNSITVTPNGTTGTISVVANSSCGSSIAQTTVPILGSAPAPPVGISGNSYICGGSQQTYSVLPVSGAASYVWTLPSGWTGTSATNSITVTTNTTSGNVTVKALNGCGQSSVTSLPVVVFTTLANPGIIAGDDSVCSGDLQTYSILPVPGATSYVWTLPSGWSGTTTGTSIQAFAGSTGGTMSVRAYVSCAISNVSTLSINVVTTVNPAVTISTPPATLCQGTPITITATPSFPGPAPVYQWKKNGAVVTGFGNTYTSNSLLKGDSVSVTMTSDAGCASNTVVSSNILYPNITPSVVPGVSINAIPPITICKGTPVTFTTVSTGTGATPTYQWFKNGVPIASATNTTYTDASLSNADTMTIAMTTTALCAAAPVATSNKVGIRVDDMVTPTVSIEVTPSEYIIPGQPVTFEAIQINGGATPGYQWQKNGVNIPYETGDTYTTSSLVPGDHISVRMLSYANCVTTDLVYSNIVEMKGSVGVRSVAASTLGMKLYPNPTAGRFTLSATSWDASFTGKQVSVDVLNAVGQLVYHMELVPSVNGSSNSWQTQIQLPETLSGGHYMLRLSTKDGGLGTTLPFILSR